MTRAHFAIFISLLIASCNTGPNSAETEKRTDSIQQVEVKDSIFKVEDLLFEGPSNMQFELVRRSENPKKSTKGDTLYMDDEIILLGNKQDIGYPGLYKKFRFNSVYEDFPADTNYNGKLAGPDFSTDDAARYFRTRIKEGCKNKGINFAGHYTIIEWGCGTSCQLMAIVNRKNGRIIFSDIPFDTLDGHSGLGYRKDSRMLIVNTDALEEHEGYKLIYWRIPEVYEFNNGKFKKIE